jgi:hypothetical protein
MGVAAGFIQAVTKLLLRRRAFSRTVTPAECATARLSKARGDERADSVRPIFENSNLKAEGRGGEASKNPETCTELESAESDGGRVRVQGRLPTDNKKAQL